MLDDGEIERRVRLIRPMEQHSVPLKMMEDSHWVEADRERFVAAWRAELAEVPEFTESTIHVVAGLLLPIWKRLPNEFDPRLSAADRRRRARHRPQGLGRLGRERSCDRYARTDAGRGLRRADGGQGRSRPCRRPSTPPRPSHGGASHRTVGLYRCHARSAQGLRPLPRDHLVEAAHVRADQTRQVWRS